MKANRKLMVLAFLLFVAHACALAVLDSSRLGTFFSNVIQLAIGILTVTACFQAASRSGAFGQMFWRLAGVGLSFLTVGLALATYDDTFLETANRHWWVIDVFVYAWTAPLVMCLFLDPEAEPEGRDWQRILDFAQVMIVFVLLYLYSSNLSAQGETSQPWRLALATDGLIMAGFFLRGASTSVGPVSTLYWRFGYFRLVAFLTDLGFVLGLHEPVAGEWFDLVWSGTVLIPLVIAATWKDSGEFVPAARPFSTYQRLLVTQLLPLTFPVLVLIMASRIAKGQLELAAGAVLISLGISYARLLATQRTQQLSAEALRRSHNLLQAIIEGTTEAIFVKDLEGRYLMINTAGAQLIGRTVTEVIGKDDHFLFTADTARLIMEGDQRVIQSGTTQTYEDVGTAAGVTRTYLSTKGPYRDSKGKVIGLIGISVDITERRKLEESLRRSQRMEAIGTLSGGIAHDFNNLLTVIKGYSSLVIDREQDEEIRSQVERIDEAAERAASLTRQLLAFSRQQMLQPKVFNLNALLMNLEKLLRRLIGEDIEMMTCPAPDVGAIKADPSQIEQVIMNLAVNARDAMPRGGKLTLETANIDLDENYTLNHPGTIPGSYIMLAVSDNGVGMDLESQAHIFEPFYTTKEVGKGTGLGLAMVYGIVKQSGGHVWVYSEPGRGTTFKVYLPFVDEPAEMVLGELRPVTTIRGNETILLVEDDRHVRELARSVLTASGYSVLAGENPQTAVSMCENYAGAIQLLVTDVVMPGLSGRELADQIIKRRPDIKVLYMSGYTNNAILNHGVLDAGIFFLQKPFTPSSLTGKVREVLDQQSTAQALP